MKKLFFVLLTFWFSFLTVFGQCDEFIYLFTQAEIDAFPQNYGCSVVEANLSIGTSNVPTFITNLDSLAMVTSILGNITFQRNISLESLSGLENLTNVQGSIRILDNDNLKSLSDLENLANIGADFIIRNNPELENLYGLENFTSIGGSLSISHNSNLINLIGLENLTSIGEDLLIYENETLENLEGLNHLNSIGGVMHMTENAVLTSVLALFNLTNVNGNYLILNHNPLLESCCIALNFIQNFDTEYIIIEYNAPSCNSIEEIIENCKGNQIQVQAFFDENENNLFDQSEQFLIESFSLEPSAAFGFADQVGITHFYLTEFGTYSIAHNPSNSLWSHNGNVENLEIDYLDSLYQDMLIQVPLVPIGDFTIHNINLTSSITRCNQLTNYWLTYTNKGTRTTDGFIELTHDELCLLDSATPPVDSVANGKFYWFYENLYPTHSNQIQLVFEMPSVDEIGEMIEFEASVQTNDGFGDDKAVLSSELICAYDPNDKLVTPYGYGDDNYTLFGDTLEYTIRFQNTGNDTAFTVVIEDKLSQHLNLNTFRPIASSHNVETQIDRESRLAKFTFNDIYLPDSFINEVGSHGFVKYRILGNADLSENTDVENTASIFFDQNPPIVTNTVSNRMVSVLPSLPVLAATPNELIFEEIALDESSYLPQILTIQNLGDLPLEIESFIFENPVFNSNQLQTLTVEGQSSTEVPIYFEPTTAGVYESMLTLKSNNGDLNISLTGTAVLETSVEAIKQTQFTIFPNPNNGQFYLKSESEKIQSIKIQNSLGQVVFEEKKVSEFLSINLGKQRKGLYFVSVETTDGVLIEKIIVK